MAHGYTEETEHYLKRLRRIEGQLRGAATHGCRGHLLH